MKFLKVATVLFLFVSTSAFADCEISNVPGLSDVAKQELKVACQTAMLESKKLETNPLAGVDVSNPEQLSQWGLVAQEWAKALGIAANELGIAVDTFLDTDAGKLTAAIIIWQVAGENIIGVVFGIPLLIVVFVVGIRTAQRAKIKRICYSDTETNWRGKPIIKEVVYWDEDETAMYWVAYILTAIFSIWIIAGVIL